MLQRYFVFMIGGALTALGVLLLRMLILPTTASLIDIYSIPALWIITGLVGYPIILWKERHEVFGEKKERWKILVPGLMAPVVFMIAVVFLVADAVYFGVNIGKKLYRQVSRWLKDTI